MVLIFSQYNYCCYLASYLACDVSETDFGCSKEKAILYKDLQSLCQSSVSNCDPIQTVQSSLLLCLPGRKTDKVVASPSYFLIERLNPISIQLSCSGLHFLTALVSSACWVTLLFLMWSLQ